MPRQFDILFESYKELSFQVVITIASTISAVNFDVSHEYLIESGFLGRAI